MYDVQAFLISHEDNQELRQMIAQLLEVWHEQDLSHRAAEDERLTQMAQDLGFGLRMHGLTADEIEAIWDYAEDFRAFFIAHPSDNVHQEPAA